jgi:hypothetical protein
MYMHHRFAVDSLNQPRVSTGRDDAIGTKPQSELGLVKHVCECLYELHRKLLLPQIITCQEKVSSAGSCRRRLVLRSSGEGRLGCLFFALRRRIFAIHASIFAIHVSGTATQRVSVAGRQSSMGEMKCDNIGGKTYRS